MTQPDQFTHAAPLSELRIDLDALAANWLFLKSRLGAGADCAGVVKADAYGLGAVPVTRALYAQGCRHFFVAHVGEAMEILPLLEDLRTAATADRAQIYVLNGPRGMTARDMAAAGLTPVLNSVEDIFYWLEKASDAPAVLHIDTGMNRLGLSTSDLDRDDVLAAISKLNLRYVMSHLACGDEPAHALNARQLAAFKQAAVRLGRPLRLSLANSSGIFLGGDYHFDLARPGCALYGINPVPSNNPMRPVAALSARIVQIRAVPAGETIGYGASYTVPETSNSGIKIYATLSLGYADGFLRSVSGRGAVYINGQRCPLVGRVSMDSIVADVSDLATPPKTGDMAEVLGASQSVDALAADAGTIGYEILTSLGRRYTRIYTGTTI